MDIKQKYTDTSDNTYYVKMYDTYKKFSYIVTPSNDVVDPDDTDIYVTITDGKKKVNIKAVQTDAYGSFSFSISDDEYEILQDGLFGIYLTIGHASDSSATEIVPMLHIMIAKGYYNKEWK